VNEIIGPLEERDMTFREFVARCARLHIVALRDTEIDETLPDQILPDDCYLTEVERLRVELCRLNEMTDDEADAAADARYKSALDEAADADERQARRLARAEALLAKVFAWEPPTPDHVLLKKTMLDQLGYALKRTDPWRPTAAWSGQEWRKDMRECLGDMLRMAESRYAKAVEQAKKETEWIRALVSSLGGPEGDGAAFGG
jgi:hypothetical protein